MRDAVDELERQLRQATRAVAEHGSLRGARGWRRTSLIAAAAVLAVSAGAVAATKLVSSKDAQSQGREIAFTALRETASLPACAKSAPTAKTVLSDSAPIPEITAALPALATPAPARVVARALAVLPPGPTRGVVLRRTLRTITMPGKITLTVYATAGFGALRDPQACAAARRARADMLDRDRPENVKQAANRALAERTDTYPGLQELWVYARTSDQPHTGAGAGAPVRPGQPLRPGLLLSSSSPAGSSLYVGIAGPHATRVLIRGPNGRPLPGAPAQTAAVQGFFAVTLPRHTGPARLHVQSKTGTTLRIIKLRG